MITRNKKIAIVIVSYNSCQKLEDCFNSLKYQNYPWELVDLILVDNNSNDDSAKLAESSFASIRIIKNLENKGFAAANNQAYELAKSLGVDYLVLLNDDTIVDPNWLNYLIDTAEQDEKIGAVQSKLMLWPEKIFINSLGNAFTFLGFGYCNHYRESDRLEIKSFEVPYASGAAVAIKMSALEKVGLFSDDFFMYHEDADLGWRLRLAGYRIILEPKSVVYHKYNFSKASYKYFYMERNRLLVFFKNYKLLTILIFLPAFLFMELGILFFALKNGWLKEKLQGYIWLIVNIKKIVSDHKEIASWRSVKDKEILQLFTASIKFEEVNNPLLLKLVNPLMEFYFWLVKKFIFW